MEERRHDSPYASLALLLLMRDGVDDAFLLSNGFNLETGVEKESSENTDFHMDFRISMVSSM